MLNEIQRLQSQQFEAEQKALQVSSCAIITCGSTDDSLGTSQFERLYQDKAQADKEKAQQIIELDRENKDTLSRIRHTNNLSLKSEVRLADSQCLHACANSLELTWRYTCWLGLYVCLPASLTLARPLEYGASQQGSRNQGVERATEPCPSAS